MKGKKQLARLSVILLASSSLLAACSYGTPIESKKTTMENKKDSPFDHSERTRYAYATNEKKLIFKQLWEGHNLVDNNTTGLEFPSATTSTRLTYELYNNLFSKMSIYTYSKKEAVTSFNEILSNYDEDITTLHNNYMYFKGMKKTSFIKEKGLESDITSLMNLSKETAKVIQLIHTDYTKDTSKSKDNFYQNVDSGKYTDQLKSLKHDLYIQDYYQSILFEKKIYDNVELNSISGISVVDNMNDAKKQLTRLLSGYSSNDELYLFNQIEILSSMLQNTLVEPIAKTNQLTGLDTNVIKEPEKALSLILDDTSDVKTKISNIETFYKTLKVEEVLKPVKKEKVSRIQEEIQLYNTMIDYAKGNKKLTLSKFTDMSKQLTNLKEEEAKYSEQYLGYSLIYDWD